MFKDLFVQLLQERSITAYKLSKDTGLSEALISNWKSGRQLPKYDSIKILCDYFDISADYLLERTSVKKINSPTKVISVAKQFENADSAKVAAYNESTHTINKD